MSDVDELFEKCLEMVPEMRDKILGQKMKDKLSCIKYNKSDKGKASQKRYIKSDKGKAASKRASKKWTNKKKDD